MAELRENFKSCHFVKGLQTIFLRGTCTRVWGLLFKVWRWESGAYDSGLGLGVYGMRLLAWFRFSGLVGTIRPFHTKVFLEKGGPWGPEGYIRIDDKGTIGFLIWGSPGVSRRNSQNPHPHRPTPNSNVDRVTSTGLFLVDV